MTAADVLLASGLFESRSDIFRTIKSKGAKINGLVVDSADEKIEPADFLNFLWTNGQAADMMVTHGPVFLMVSRGKRQRALVKVLPDGSLVDGIPDLLDSFKQEV